MEKIYIIGVAMVGVLVLGLYKNLAMTTPRKYLHIALVLAVVLGIIVGLLGGTVVTHAFDIYWWLFSIIYFILLVIPALLLAGLMRVLLFFKNKA